MHRDLLIARLLKVLEYAGFTTSERCDVRPRSFDLAARRGSLLLLLKVLTNIDGLSAEIAREMRCLAEHLFASPLIVGEKVSERPLEEGAIYIRYGIPSVNLKTLYMNFVEDVPPLVYAAPGGLYVNIDEDVLRQSRTGRGMSLGELASKLGVSRRTISKYEAGMGITVEIALKLESILDVPLVRSINVLHMQLKEESSPLAPLSALEQTILTMLTDMGFDVVPIAHAPFSVVSHDRGVTMLTGIGRYTDTMIKKARLMSSISDVAQTQSVFIIEGPSKSSQIGSTALVRKDELDDVEDSSDFITLIRDKTGKSTNYI